MKKDNRKYNLLKTKDKHVQYILYLPPKEVDIYMLYLFKGPWCSNIFLPFKSAFKIKQAS